MFVPTPHVACAVRTFFAFPRGAWEREVSVTERLNELRI